ncbi:MAG TPA: lytic transglycosylase domain-containing protein [Mycobacterium sp.]
MPQLPRPRLTPHTVVAACAVACLLGTAAPVRADLVTFTTGRTMSVKAHRVDGDAVVFTLRAGGEMSVDAALVASIGPDEVPYPEPVVEVSPEAVPLRGPAPVLAVNPTYDPIIQRMAAEQGVDASLVRAVIQVESAYQPRARSSKGAVGLMQVMPATGRQYGIRNLYDPASNIRAGVTHLKALLDRFPLALALAAYNAGEAAVERFSGIPPYPETLDYVSRIRALVGR